MRRTISSSTGLVLVLVLISSLASAVPVNAVSSGQGSAPLSTASDADVRVRVGATPDSAQPLPFSYTRFYPERLQVHRGQTVAFDHAERTDLHTVSFWPAGDGGRPPLFRTDEGPEGVAITEVAFERADCGDADQAPCVLTRPDQQLSSGLSAIVEPTWRVTVDLPVGTAIGYICQVHPGMTGEIEVVDEDVPLPTQAELDAQTRQQVEADTQEALAHRAALEANVVQTTDGNRDVWRVMVGDSTPSGHVSIMSYMPGYLPDVRPGDAVEFVSSGAGHHSVTFPTSLVGDKNPGAGLAFSVIHPACDFDDVNDGAPGIGGPWAPFSPAVCPGAFELIVTPYLSSSTRAPGDAVVTPATYHDSGLMWAEDAPTPSRQKPGAPGQFFPHRFVAEMPSSGTFGYSCTVHGTDVMSGVVRVRAGV